MAGLDEVQWKIVETGLSKLDGIAERLSKLESAIIGNGTKGLNQRIGELECAPDKKKNWIANIVSLAIAAIAVGIAYFKP